MGRVTIYLEDEVEAKMAAAAASVHLSKSKWVAALVKAKIANKWPDFVKKLPGAWNDMELTDDADKNIGSDIQREKL